MTNIRPLIVPTLLLIGYLILVFIFRIHLPDLDTLLVFITKLYAQYGYYIVFFGALFEALFLISLYFPGSTVVLLGAALSKTGIMFFPLVIILATVGLVTGFCIDYFLGKYGFYHVFARFGLEKGITTAQEHLHTHTYKTFFLGFAHPSSGSIIATAAGVTHMSFKRFFVFAFFSQLFWSFVWGTIAYIFGLQLVEFFIRYFGYIVFLGFIIFLLKKKKVF